MKTLDKAPVPADLPALAIGFLAKHVSRADRLAMYRRDGSMSNSYPAGYDISMVREAFDFGPCEVLDNGHVVLRPPAVLESPEE